MKDTRYALMLSFFTALCAIAVLWMNQQALTKALEQQAASNTAVEQAISILQKQSPPLTSDPTENAAQQETSLSSPALNNIAHTYTPASGLEENTEQINQLKANFESLFVTYQYLAKCGLAEEADYHLLNSALVHQMSSLNAPGRIQYDILTAAQGTYDEIYSRSTCDTPDISTMQEQFRNYLNEAAKVRFVVK